MVVNYQLPLLLLCFSCFLLSTVWVPVEASDAAVFENQDLDIIYDDVDVGQDEVMQEKSSDRDSRRNNENSDSNGRSGSDEASSTDYSTEYQIDDAANSVFSKLLGPTLYQWDRVSSETEHYITEVSTNDVLQGQKVIGIYFSASWCGPCKQFTPLLTKFYEDMNKKGKKFEVVWVSRDQSQEQFINYYNEMPWLALTLDRLDTVGQTLASKYHMKGIPHLVIVDGYDASVYTLDGRTKVMQDKYGMEFPWQPRTLMNALPRPVRNYIKFQIKALKNKTILLLRGVLEGLSPKSVLEKIFSLTKTIQMYL